MSDFSGSDTAASLLDSARGETDTFYVNAEGDLEIDGVRADSLADRYGAPLYVMSETAIRANFRRFKAAFSRFWPVPVDILYAVKANPNPAICKILAAEGAGFDCTGFGELILAHGFGGNAEKTTLNGSNKTDDEINQAIRANSVIVLDAASDVELTAELAEQCERDVRVLIRLKAFDADLLADFEGDAYTSNDKAAAVLAGKKWGVGFESAKGVIEKVQASSRLSLLGYHVHIGRLTRDANIVSGNVAAFARDIVRLCGATGYWPSLIDIGGGWPADRDPEARTDKLNPVSIEGYANQVCRALRSGFEAMPHPLPALWLEPGRYIVNNAGVLLTRVGTIKHDQGRCWVNVDASGEWLVLTTIYGASNMILPAGEVHRKLTERVDIVGPNCIPAVFGKDRKLPLLERGELLAIFDAGAYSESQASVFNSMPRPATALACEGCADLITRRETYDDLQARFVMPARYSA